MEPIAQPPSETIHQRHWSVVAKAYAHEASAHTRASRRYRQLIGRYLRFYIPEGASVLEIGCGEGCLHPELPGREYTGVDLREAAVEKARATHPDAQFFVQAGETVHFERSFDYIILSDVLNEAADVQEMLLRLKAFSTPETRIVINIHNTLWRPVLWLATALRLKPKRPPLNWLSGADLANLIELAGWQTVRRESRILCPVPLLGIGTLLNRYIAPFIPWLCLSLFSIARPAPRPFERPASVSVIIPARNEAGNIPAAVARTPDMGSETEIIFVEGHSQDDTWDAIQQAIADNPTRNIRAYRQTGKGKGDAMRLGYEQAEGEIIMILDADLTVPPEDLPKFYDAIASGQAEFANGVRLVYPMEDAAMRFLNMCGNKFFSLLFSWLLSLPIKDTLCGTKVFTQAHYRKIEANRAFFGDFDPFGDFDLIFGAAKLNLHLRDIPIRYQNRTYGEPQIDRWRDGWLLIKMSRFAARKLKFF